MKTYGVMYKWRSKHSPVFILGMQDYLIRPCGDRSVIILDGRKSLENKRAACREWAIKHGYCAFRIEKGSSLLDLQPSDKMQII